MDHLKASRALKTTDAHIITSSDVVAYRERMKKGMPAWREEQIKMAHQALLRAKPKPRIVKRLTHPVLIGDRG